jgi:hypothetical protein
LKEVENAHTRGRKGPSKGLKRNEKIFV